MIITMQTVSVLATMTVDELKALLVASRGVQAAPVFTLPGMARAFAAYKASRATIGFDTTI